MSAATLMAGLSPAQWRALNALFYAVPGGMNVVTLRVTQALEWQQLVDLEAGWLITAQLGPKVPVKLADMVRPTAAVRVHLTGTGRNKCIRNRANQVITTLGGKANQSARVRDCKGEGMADDDLLFKMAAAGLIIPQESGVYLSMFKRLPWNLVLRLTSTGRAYFPHDMVGSMA